MAPKVHISPSAHEQGSALSKTGLLAGVPGADGGDTYILTLLPHPARPDGVSALSWAETHASSVSRMLPGGVEVLGAYTSATSPRSLGEAFAVAAAVAPSSALVLTAGSSGRLVARMGSASAKALDVRTARIAPVRVEATLRLAAVPLVRAADETPPALLAAERACLVRAQQLVARAAFLAAGGPAVLCDNDDMAAADAFGWEKKAAPEKKAAAGKKGKRPKAAVGAAAAPSVVRGEMLLPLSGADGADGACCDDAMPGHGPDVALQGTLALRAVVMPRSTLGGMLKALRADAARSLAARATALAEGDRDAEEEGDAVWPPVGAGERGLPARVAVRGKGASADEVLEYAEYVFAAEEAAEDVLPRVKEMLVWTEEEEGRYEVVLVEQIEPAIVEVRGNVEIVDACAAEGLKGNVTAKFGGDTGGTGCDRAPAHRSGSNLVGGCCGLGGCCWNEDDYDSSQIGEFPRKF